MRRFSNSSQLTHVEYVPCPLVNICHASPCSVQKVILAFVPPRLTRFLSHMQIILNFTTEITIFPADLKSKELNLRRWGLLVGACTQSVPFPTAIC